MLGESNFGQEKLQALSRINTRKKPCGLLLAKLQGQDYPSPLETTSPHFLSKVLHGAIEFSVRPTMLWSNSFLFPFFLFGIGIFIPRYYTLWLWIFEFHGSSQLSVCFELSVCFSEFTRNFELWWNCWYFGKGVLHFWCMWSHCVSLDGMIIVYLLGN